MVINKFLIAFLVLLGSSSSWAGIRERFDYKVTRSADGTEIYLYSISDNYKETRVYDKNGFLRSLNSRVGDVSLEVTPNSMLFQKSDAKSYQRYYFEKAGKAFVLTRMIKGKPEVYYKKGCEAYVGPDRNLRDLKPQMSKSCEPYNKLIQETLDQLQDEKVVKCLKEFSNSLTANALETELERNTVLSQIDCDPKVAGSEYNTGTDRITLGMNFLGKSVVEGREVFLHELMHMKVPTYRRPKENRCGPNATENIEEEVNQIAKGCLSSPEKLAKLSASQEEEFNSKQKSLDDQIRKSGISGFKANFNGRVSLSNGEFKFFLSKIQQKENLNKFNKDNISNKDECLRVTKEIFQETCPLLDFKGELSCIFIPTVKISSANTEALETPNTPKTGAKPSADAAVVPITASSLSSEPIPVLNQRLPESVEVLHQQIPDMLPNIETSNSFGSPRQLMNDLQAAAKNLVLPIATADTNDLPASVQNRLRAIQASAPAEPSGKAVNAFKMELVAKTLVNTARADEPATPTYKRGSVDKISNQAVANEVAVSKSSGATEGTSQSLTGTSGVASSESGAVSAKGSVAASMTAKLSAPVPVAKSQAVSLDHNPVEYLNREFASRAQSEQVIKDLKAREAELRAKNIQVIIGNERIGSLTPKRKLKWDKNRFVEQNN